MALAEVEDLLCYTADILDQAAPPVKRHLCHVLWRAFSGPCMFWPLLHPQFQPTHAKNTSGLRPARREPPD